MSILKNITSGPIRFMLQDKKKKMLKANEKFPVDEKDVDFLKENNPGIFKYIHIIKDFKKKSGNKVVKKVQKKKTEKKEMKKEENKQPVDTETTFVSDQEENKTNTNNTDV